MLDNVQAFGATLLGIGIWLAVDPDAFEASGTAGMDDSTLAAAVYTIIGIGAFLFVVGGLGCYGAWGKGHPCILSMVHCV